MLATFDKLLQQVLGKDFKQRANSAPTGESAADESNMAMQQQHSTAAAPSGESAVGGGDTPASATTENVRTVGSASYLRRAAGCRRGLHFALEPRGSRSSVPVPPPVTL
jgi:hypothetical protein